MGNCHVFLLSCVLRAPHIPTHRSTDGLRESCLQGGKAGEVTGLVEKWRMQDLRNEGRFMGEVGSGKVSVCSRRTWSLKPSAGESPSPSQTEGGG